MNYKKDDSNLIVDLTNDEAYALSYLHGTNSEWANAFKNVLLKSRDKISQRLITSLHREDLVHSRENSQIIATRQLDFNIEMPQPYVLKIVFPNDKKTLYAPISGQHAFDRIDVEGPFYFECNSRLERILHPNEILDSILIESPVLDNDASNQFKDDMNNSVANMAIALSYQLITLSINNEPLLELIINEKDSYLRSEQAVIEGHPLHPGAKLRKGMTPQTAIEYSSEFANEISMKFILIHCDIAKVQTLTKAYNDTIFTLFEGLYEVVCNTISRDEIESYYVMAVHPWQYDAVLASDYANELKKQQLIPLDYTLIYFAGLSFRTLMPHYPETAPHIKLSTNVHITGEIRTLSEQTTFNGPQVTAIINKIKKHDPLFSNINADTIDELAGIHFYNKEDTSGKQIVKSEQLGSLFRENIYNLIAPNTTPMIPSSLVAQYANNQETPIVTLIKKYTNTHNFKNYEDACIDWMQHYSQALIDLALPLYAKYGIALEAHLQNSIASFKEDGLIHTLYIRDFEGLRIDKNYLNQMGYSTSNFHEKSLILTDQSQTVFNKMFYSSIQNHLGELILTIAQSSNNKNLEQNIWSMISDIIFKKLQEIENSMNNTPRINDIQSILFAPKIDYKCVTTMRLKDEADYYTYIQVNNPLYRILD
ncbi:IucA/IucC family protein [Staphylococcus sp. NAM3COL9]|uniref:IucA/IucC family protein n=1 Tax=Staphylococcus sp. NAM3COL9 TaxID=1667172 RepID=UPI00070DA0FF|nr:IucA/IucC family protein [Staphylococcus sp. NAM3COL9]KRG08044.1 sialic acid synthase [Staphylococcus sp. NAM3COL9]